MNTFIIYFDKGGNLERRYMQNTINIAKELVDAINNIGIEKNKTNLYIFDNNNMTKKLNWNPSFQFASLSSDLANRLHK